MSGAIAGPILAVGVYLTAYTVSTPGDQKWHAFFGGALISTACVVLKWRDS